MAKDRYVLVYQRSLKGIIYPSGKTFPNKEYPVIDYEFKKMIADGSAVSEDSIVIKDFKPRLSPMQKKLLQKYKKEKSQEPVREREPEPVKELEKIYAASEEELQNPPELEEMTIQELRTRAKELGINSYQKSADDLRQEIQTCIAQ